MSYSSPYLNERQPLVTTKLTREDVEQELNNMKHSQKKTFLFGAIFGTIAFTWVGYFLYILPFGTEFHNNTLIPPPTSFAYYLLLACHTVMAAVVLLFCGDMFRQFTHPVPYTGPRIISFKKTVDAVHGSTVSSPSGYRAFMFSRNCVLLEKVFATCGLASLVALITVCAARGHAQQSIGISNVWSLLLPHIAMVLVCGVGFVATMYRFIKQHNANDQQYVQLNKQIDAIDHYQQL